MPVRASITATKGGNLQVERGCFHEGGGCKLTDAIYGWFWGSQK